jgi:hypothetical protein
VPYPKHRFDQVVEEKIANLESRIAQLEKKFREPFTFQAGAESSFFFGQRFGHRPLQRVAFQILADNGALAVKHSNQRQEIACPD